MALPALDQQVRLDAYRGLIDTGASPTVLESAARLGAEPYDVTAARHRLAALHALALQPGSAEVWMAHPFSAVPTGYRVRPASGDPGWWANCGWDALAIPTMVGVDAAIEATCPDCGHAFDLRVEGGALHGEDAVVQFCVPPSQFWDDIGFT